MSYAELSDTYIAGTYGRFPVEIQSSEHSFVRDTEERTFIDLGSGIAVNTFGHDEGWAEAVAAQARLLAHTSNLYYTEPQARFAQTLCERTDMKRVFFSNSGAEANECLLKTARKWAADRWGENVRSGILALENSFHGRTLFTLAATGQEQFHHDFGPFPAGFSYVRPNDMDALETAFDAAAGTCCAILMELVQGEGGVVVLEPSFVQRAAALAEKHECLLCIDEVQTGNGRTGTLFAYEQYGIRPDIVSTAKGLAGGLPMGATLFGEHTANTLTPGSHGSTFGGNPICAAAASYVWAHLDEACLQGVKERAAYIASRLPDLPWATGSSGLGLMIGIACKEGFTAKQIAAAALEKGVMVLTAHEKVRLLPPLNIPMDVLAQAMDVLAGIVPDAQ
ncbi:MAG: aminotransferase class III-fold pyridoxal phosphate-dependent enzyme [Oscillospiraceae bacterium]|jgi:acetylornithine/N-succinyldiaminopimelate aminotransferase|nr:aminotransferase class III-fold pyridoxal phosphate-dependent enzyme [Oscillospiraceae bacterium]